MRCGRPTRHHAAVSGNDDAFFGWNDDGGVSPVKKATQKKAAKAAKTMNDDATIVVSAPDIGNATSAGDDQDTTHESTAPASSTCKGNSDCPRGANGHLNRCIEGTCKDIGITAVKSPSLAAATTASSQRLHKGVCAESHATVVVGAAAAAATPSASAAAAANNVPC